MSLTVQITATIKHLVTPYLWTFNTSPRSERRASFPLALLEFPLDGNLGSKWHNHLVRTPVSWVSQPCEGRHRVALCCKRDTFLETLGSELRVACAWIVWLNGVKVSDHFKSILVHYVVITLVTPVLNSVITKNIYIIWPLLHDKLKTKSVIVHCSLFIVHCYQHIHVHII